MSVKIIHINPEFKDERGFISRVLDDKKVSIKSILYIARKKGSDGGNHYHKKDSHYIYVLSGKIKYYEKNLRKKTAKLETAVLKSGDMVLSPSGYAHFTEFLEDTVFMTFATEHRSQKEYEDDTIRLEFIHDEAANK